MLASPEGDDAADWIVRRHANGHAIAGHDLDAEAAHAAAQLCQHFVTGITLHAVESAAVHCDDRALHVDEIVLAQKPLAILSSGPTRLPCPPYLAYLATFVTISNHFGIPATIRQTFAPVERAPSGIRPSKLTTQESRVQIPPPQPLSKTAARIEPSRSPAAAAAILPRFPNTISLLQRRFLSGESRD